MGVNASDLDRRIQFRRRTTANGPLGPVDHWADHGSPVSASRRDVSDAEKFAAGTVQAAVETRFIVRANIFTRGMGPSDRLVCAGREYDIKGIKEFGERHRWFEISGSALVAS